MIVTGFTDSKLTEVATYNKNFPYQVGVNGVTQVLYAPGTGFTPTFVEYVINGITYQTQIGSELLPGLFNLFKTNTVYYFPASGLTEQEVNVIKYEAEMGISEPTKIEKEIFIERQSISVFERHLRIGEIGTIEQLEQYKNGYYNIFNIE
jgi:hypothetical protein